MSGSSPPIASRRSPGPSRRAGEQEEVEGHAYRRGLSDKPEVEGHGWRFNGLSDDPNVAYTIRFTDDDGQEQEVEAHYFRSSDLRLKRDVEPLRDALAKVGTIAIERR